MSLPRRARRILWIAAACLGLYTVVGFFVLPPIVKSQLEKRLSAALDRPVAVGKVRVNPYTLSLTIERLDVRERDGKGSFAGWNRLYVNFDLLPSIFGQWVFSAIALDEPHLRTVVNPDGSLNFSDLLTKLGAPEKPGSPARPAAAARPIRVGSLKLTGATVDFTDNSRSAPFHTVVGPLRFTLTGFRTLGGREAPYSFAAVTDAGEKLAWQGWILAAPLRSGGEWSVENLDLKRYAPYYADRVRADLTAGRLNVRSRYELNLDAAHRMLRLVDGSLQLRDLRVVERGTGQPLLTLPAFDVSGIEADGVARTATVGSVTLAGGQLDVRRSKDGQVNLLALLPPSGPAAAPPPTVSLGAPPAAAPALPHVAIGEISVKDFAVVVEDLAAPRPVQLALTKVQFSLKHLALDSDKPMPLEASFLWSPQGTVSINGTLTLRPDVSAALKTGVTDLAILPFSPYLEQMINARITQGTVSLQAELDVAMTQPTPAVTMAGDVRVERFGQVDGAKSEELAGYSSLALRGLKVTSAPRPALSLAELKVDDPYGRAVREADKTLNLAAVLKAAPAAPAAATVTALPAAEAGPKIDIAKVTISGGNFSFADHSLEPNVQVALGQFGGTISGLSAENPARADVDLHGQVDGVGPLSVVGKLDPLGVHKSVDLKVDLRGMDLLPLSPYSGKYAGYELARGKLSLDVNAQVADEKIDMANVVTLNQFTFGAATHSPDATHLPVRLGVALLKDLDGKIVIDVPVVGRLGDPSFRIGKVVWRVIGNLLTKAAVSPFALLGSMFGGGGEELSYQEFAPGATVPLASENGKLETLVKALTNRPGLSLSLSGSYDAAADTYALKQQKLADLIRRRIWEERRAADPNIAPPAQLTITPEEHDAMLKKLFDEKFPPGTEFGAPLPKPPVVTPPPPPPKPGFFKRVVNVITLEGIRSRHAEEKAQAKAEAKATEEYKAETAAAVAAGLPPEVMTARLADSMVVTDDELRALALARATDVRDYLVNTGKIAPDRLFLAQPTKTTPAQLSRGPRVFLELQ